MNADNIAMRMTQRLRAHRVFLFWSVPVCFVVVYALMFCVPTTFRSEWSLVSERIDAADEYRTLTLNSPEQYDLGLAQSRSGIDADDYRDLVLSPQVLRPLLSAPVSTLDGRFVGTYGDYVNQYMRKPLLSRVRSGVRRCFRGEQSSGSRPSCAVSDVFLTREEATTLAVVRKQIGCTYDKQSDIVRIEVVTQDPLVSAEVAKHLENSLQAQIEGYYAAKAQRLLAHIDSLAAHAGAQWQDAVRTHSSDAPIYRLIYDSFRRQQVICQAQMVAPKPFVTLSEPVVVYAPKGPHRLLTALLLALLYGLAAGAWICRREIAEAL